MSLEELFIQSEKIENVTIYKLQGNINSFTSQRFLDGIKKGVLSGATILDLEEINLVSSQGVTAFKELSDISFSNRSRVLLINLSPSVRQVFNMAGIKNLFMIPENEELAMKIASRPYR